MSCRFLSNFDLLSNAAYNSCKDIRIGEINSQSRRASARPPTNPDVNIRSSRAAEQFVRAAYLENTLLFSYSPLLFPSPSTTHSIFYNFNQSKSLTSSSCIARRFIPTIIATTQDLLPQTCIVMLELRANASIGFCSAILGSAIQVPEPS